MTYYGKESYKYNPIFTPYNPNVQIYINFLKEGFLHHKVFRINPRLINTLVIIWVLKSNKNFLKKLVTLNCIC